MPALSKKAKMQKTTLKTTTKFGKKVKVNQAFKTKHGLSYAGKEPDDAVASVGLKRLDQASYDSVCKLGQAASKKMLVDAGVVLQTGATKPGDASTNFICWCCGQPITKKEQTGTLRCDNTGCKDQPRISMPEIAFTPLAGQASAGYDADYQMCLRTAYALGCKIPNDAAAHIVRREDESIMAAEHKVTAFFAKHKMALAYSEVARANTFVFDNDVVEPDSCRTGSKKNGSKTGTKGNHGRTLVVKGRFKKNWVAKPMPSKDSKKGPGGGGPESLPEVEETIAKLFGIGTVAAPDGSQAFHSAAQKAGKPSLKGVSHGTKVFTPVSKLLKSKLDKSVLKMLRSNSKGKVPAVKETARYFVLAAGDNAAEGQTGHIKNTMRRLGNVGRFQSPAVETKNVQALSAAALLRHAGLKTVLNALKQYRLACSTGVVATKPKDAFQSETAKRWMFQQ